MQRVAPGFRYRLRQRDQVRGASVLSALLCEPARTDAMRSRAARSMSRDLWWREGRGLHPKIQGSEPAQNFQSGFTRDCGIYANPSVRPGAIRESQRCWFQGRSCSAAPQLQCRQRRFLRLHAPLREREVRCWKISAWYIVQRVAPGRGLLPAIGRLASENARRG